MTEFDLAVLGGGPGGYVAAIRGAQLGMSVACIDENAQLGGTCLRVGCIPSKALLESSERFVETREGLAEHGVVVEDVRLDLAAMQRRKDKIVKTLAGGVDSLFKQHGIARLAGGASARTRPAGRQERQRAGGTDSATHYHRHRRPARTTARRRIPGGSGRHEHRGPGVRRSPGPPGRDRCGVYRVRIGKCLEPVGGRGHGPGSARSNPGRHGSGTGGCGQKLFEKQGLKFRLGARVQAVNVAKDKCTVECAGSDPVKCDRVLVAIGRTPNTDRIGLDTVGIELSRHHEIPVGDRFNTSAADIYAIGDCIRGPKLAHKASHEGIACVEMLAGSHGHMNYDAIPGVVYTHPELASVGKTEEQLQQAGRAYRKGIFPFQASGRARSIGNTDGRVKVLADSQTDRLLGVHILGPRQAI